MVKLIDSKRGYLHVIACLAYTASFNGYRTKKLKADEWPVSLYLNEHKVMRNY